MRLLNVGCGPVQPTDDLWTNLDSDPRWAGPNCIHADPLALHLPWPDGAFDGATSVHVLQMVAWPDLIPWLSEVRRVVDGPVRLSVPDIMEAITAWHGGDRGWFPIAAEHEPSIDGAFCLYVTQAGATRSIFTVLHLIELCSRAGFQTARVEQHGVCEWLPALAALDTRPNESLIVTAL